MQLSNEKLLEFYHLMVKIRAFEALEKIRKQHPDMDSVPHQTQGLEREAQTEF